MPVEPAFFCFASALLLAGTLEHALGALVRFVSGLLSSTGSSQGFFSSLLSSASGACSAVSSVQSVVSSLLGGACSRIGLVDSALLSGGTACSQSSGHCKPGDRQFTHGKSPYWSFYFL